MRVGFSKWENRVQHHFSAKTVISCDPVVLILVHNIIGKPNRKKSVCIISFFVFTLNNSFIEQLFNEFNGRQLILYFDYVLPELLEAFRIIIGM